MIRVHSECLPLISRLPTGDSVWGSPPVVRIGIRRLAITLHGRKHMCGGPRMVSSCTRGNHAGGPQEIFLRKVCCPARSSWERVRHRMRTGEKQMLGRDALLADFAMKKLKGWGRSAQGEVRRERFYNREKAVSSCPRQASDARQLPISIWISGRKRPRLWPGSSSMHPAVKGPGMSDRRKRESGGRENGDSTS